MATASPETAPKIMPSNNPAALDCQWNGARSSLLVTVLMLPYGSEPREEHVRKVCLS
jgi:hypothetical protein